MGQLSAVVLLHLRRLDLFLKHQGLHRTAHTLEREAVLQFDAQHLQNLVRRGRWSAAWSYLTSFSPLWEPEVEGTNQQLTALLDSLSHDSMLAFLACRGEEGGRAAKSLFPGTSESGLPCDAADAAFRTKFAETVQRYDLCHSMASAEARASVDWDGIKRRTLDRLHELLRLLPDLECSLRMRQPQHMPAPLEIIPLGSRGSRRHQRKRPNPTPARELAQFLLQKRLHYSRKTNPSNDSGIPSATSLQLSSVAAKSSDVFSSAANTGMKYPRCQDDLYTANAHQACEPIDCSKRPRRAGDAVLCSSEQ